MDVITLISCQDQQPSSRQATQRSQSSQQPAGRHVVSVSGSPMIICTRLLLLLQASKDCSRCFCFPRHSSSIKELFHIFQVIIVAISNEVGEDVESLTTTRRWKN